MQNKKTLRILNPDKRIDLPAFFAFATFFLLHCLSQTANRVKRTCIPSNIYYKMTAVFGLFVFSIIFQHFSCVDCVYFSNWIVLCVCIGKNNSLAIFRHPFPSTCLFASSDSIYCFRSSFIRSLLIYPSILFFNIYWTWNKFACSLAKYGRYASFFSFSACPHLS